jgi:hypothetical protein
MNTSRIFLLLLTALFVLVVLTGAIRLAGRAFRRITEVPYKESNAYTVWFTGTVFMLAASFLPATNVLFEAVDLLYRSTAGPNTPSNLRSSFASGLTTAGILILVASAWFWCWQMLGSYLTRSIIGKADSVVEMELDNAAYFASRYLLTLLCMTVLLPFYLSLLRYFLPEITLPFYR